MWNKEFFKVTWKFQYHFWTVEIFHDVNVESLASFVQMPATVWLQDKGQKQECCQQGVVLFGNN